MRPPFRMPVACHLSRPFRGRRSSRWLLATALVALPAFVSGFVARADVDGRGAGPAEWTNDLSPVAESHWSRDRVAHLIERAGFGGTPEEIDRLASMTPLQAVDYLVE